MIQKAITLLFLSSALVSCSSANKDVKIYRKEARLYCDAHKPEYWIKSGRIAELNAMNPTDKTLILIKAFRRSVTSKEMVEIIFDEGGKLPAKDFYPFLQQKIPHPNLPKSHLTVRQFPNFIWRNNLIAHTTQLNFLKTRLFNG